MNTKTFSNGSTSITISTMPTTKIPSAFMFININTKENALLSALSTKYMHEKCLKLISNARNNAFKMIPGPNGIIINCPENKIVPNIIQYITYLKSAVVKKNKYFSKSKGSYSNLVKDLDKFNVKIIGKCKTFTKNCIEPKETAKKITTMINTLKLTIAKEREDISNPDFEDNTYNVKCKNGVALDLLILFGCLPIRTTNDGISICRSCGGCVKCFDESTFKAQLKAFRGQFGAIGSKKDEKAKAKVKSLIEIAKMITKVKGVEKVLEPKAIEEIDSDSLPTAKNIIKELSGCQECEQMCEDIHELIAEMIKKKCDPSLIKMAKEICK